jgi:xanthine dehydrogenase accessory factor
MMNKEQCLLVCGVGERASAVARRLLGEGYAVVLHQESPPRALRRRMGYADAWFDGAATLGAVEARLARSPKDFLCGMQTRQFIPILSRPFAEVVERWPWDAIIAAPDEGERPAPRLLDLAGLTIGVGSGFVAGADCDLVVCTEGLDPGAVLRAGDTPPHPRIEYDRRALEYWDVIAPVDGLFAATLTIGAKVAARDLLGRIGETEVRAPVAGRISGLARAEIAYLSGMPVAEIATAEAAPVVGVSERNKLIARGASFAVEMETQGFAPVAIGSRFRGG